MLQLLTTFAYPRVFAAASLCSWSSTTSNCGFSITFLAIFYYSSTKLGKLRSSMNLIFNIVSDSPVVVSNGHQYASKLVCFFFHKRFSVVWLRTVCMVSTIDVHLLDAKFHSDINALAVQSISIHHPFALQFCEKGMTVV